MIEVKREQLREQFLKVHITLKNREELLVLVAALGNMSLHDYEEKIKCGGWGGVRYHDLEEIGQNLYCRLNNMV